MAKLVECIPNFSEGVNEEIVNKIVNEIIKVSGVKLTDKQMNADHNRAVITFVGPPEAAKEAAFNACKMAMQLIDLNKHKGEHPRIGATDVIPFVPITDVSMEECVELARSLAKEIAEKLNIPTYLYEEAALIPERKDLAYVRNIGYEKLKEDIKTDPKRVPDFGPRELHPTAGATVVGAREYLIAYNVNLGTNNIEIAKNIAKAVRFKTGGFKAVKALGFEIKERGIVQVSMNMTNYKETPLFRAFELVKLEAERYGVPVIGSEIVGVLPLKALVDTADWYLRLENFSEDQILEKKVWGEKELLPKEFLSELASKKATPGGGAVSALAGAMGAALVCMVCELTIGKEKYKDVEEELKTVLDEAKQLKEELLLFVEKDMQAFNKVMECFKLPKETEEQKTERTAKIQEALKGAAMVPIEIMKKTKRAVELATIAAKKGSANCISDAGVSATQLQSATQGAWYNVMINLSMIKDTEFNKKAKEEANQILDFVSQATKEIHQTVLSKITE